MAGDGVENLKALITGESETKDVGFLGSPVEHAEEEEEKKKKKNMIGESESKALIGSFESPTESKVEHEKKKKKKNMIDESKTKDGGLLESPMEHEKNLKAHMIDESETKDFGLFESPTKPEVKKPLKKPGYKLFEQLRYCFIGAASDVESTYGRISSRNCSIRMVCVPDGVRDAGLVSFCLPQSFTGHIPEGERAASLREETKDGEDEESEESEEEDEERGEKDELEFLSHSSANPFKRKHTEPSVPEAKAKASPCDPERKTKKEKNILKRWNKHIPQFMKGKKHKTNNMTSSLKDM